ncbi:MAG: flagellar filament capping protein FliD [Pseudomonadales bacterium]|nr:flagellar filament capping protein FliD [Pseudomonadales bacterium]
MEVAIEAGAATLQDVATSINEAGAGVTAAVINDGTGERLVLAAEATGAANTISITVADDDGTNGDASGLSRLAYPSGSGAMTELVAPLDAELNVNGLAVTRPSNEIDDLLPDVTLSLQGADPGRSVSVGVETDLAQVRSAVQSFVKSYNALTDQVKKVSSYNAEAQTGGPLVGDSTIRGLMSELRSGLIGGLVDGGTFTRLVEIGIRTSEGGGLEIDDEALTAALESDLPAVNELLAGAGERFGALVDRYSGSDGRFAARTDGIDARLEDIADRREALARRLAQVEARYRREFGALDTLIANLASTGDFLSSQLANLPRIQGPRS